MVEKKFFLHSTGDLQRVGLRAQVVSFLIESGIEKGNVLNDSNDKKKVIVAIKFDATPADRELELKEIEQLKTTLVKHLNGLSQLDPECYGQMPNDINASALQDLNNPHVVTVVDLQRLSSSLMLEQTSKGVGAMLTLSHTMQATLAPLKTLPEILDRLTRQKPL